MSNLLKKEIAFITKSTLFRSNFCTCTILYSGHNKWSTIKHDKMKNDAERNKTINKYVNQIGLAVKLKDTKISQLIEKATKENVPKKVIDNAIKKAEAAGNATSGGNINYYEGMGPCGVAIIVETQTNNKNRTIALVRAQFNKHDLNLSSGSSLFFFNKLGKIKFVSPDDYDTVFERLIDIEGIEELEQHDNVYEVTTAPTLTNKIALEIRDHGFELEASAIEYIPKEDMRVHVHDEQKEQLNHFIEELCSIEDVTNVYSNEST